MKLNDLISILLDCQAEFGGDVEVKVNADDICRLAKFDKIEMVPVGVSGYNEEFDCIELF